MSPEAKIHVADVVVVGTGVAGMMTALHARGRSVVLLTKATVESGSSSSLAQGGVAVALAPGDSPEQHAADTVKVGGGLCDPEVVRMVTTEGPARIRELLDLGTRLDRGESGDLAFGREAAHSQRRVVHASGDATGAELVRSLAEATRAAQRITVEEGMLVLDLVMKAGRVIGVAAVDRDHQYHVFLAGAVVLATGGIGQLWAHTTNPAEATGDGLAMAARAGALLTGLEFVQFHPTALADGNNPMALLTEALRGEGATVIDETAHRFMAAVHPLAELAPRDVVARAIWHHAADGHGVFLDARHLGSRLADRFPTVTGLCHERGLDPQAEPLPISPAAHYHMGGVVIGPEGRSSVPGLWACGEVSHSGLHGANRLASNSLLEALVYGARVGDALAAELLVTPNPRQEVPLAWPERSPWLADDSEADAEAAELRKLMWNTVGLDRCEAGLARAEKRLTEHDERWLGELNNMLTNARLITRAARIRTESRGGHFRSDVPMTDHHWRQNLYFTGEYPRAPHPVDAPGFAVG